MLLHGPAVCERHSMVANTARSQLAIARLVAERGTYAFAWSFSIRATRHCTIPALVTSRLHNAAPG